jgi:hypothetical protein
MPGTVSERLTDPDVVVPVVEEPALPVPELPVVPSLV